MESIGKLSNFHWTKTFYQSILTHTAFFFTLFKGYNNTKDNFLQEPEKINFKFHRNWEKTGESSYMRFQFLKFEAFEVCFLGLQ